MPNDFFATKYWKLKKDHAIPQQYGDSYNAIFTLKGMKEIAQYYREKYNIEIYPFKSTKEQAPAVLQNLLNDAKKSSIHKCGFLWWNIETNHAIPIIYENNNLFLLDSLGEISNREIDNVLFRKSLTNVIPNIILWKCLTKRQVDITSCTTDALIILKDGLRLPFLKMIESEKCIKELKSREKNFFYLPESLLKSSQIHSVLRDSHAEISKKILTGKHNKHITLENFRKKYDIPTIIYKEQKIKSPPIETNFIGQLISFFKSEPPKNFIAVKRNFGSFTLYKGKKYMELIKKRWIKRNELLEEIEKAHDHLSNILSDIKHEDSNQLITLKNRLSHYSKMINFDGVNAMDHTQIIKDLELYTSLLPGVKSMEPSKVAPQKQKSPSP